MALSWSFKARQNVALDASSIDRRKISSVESI
jgi:hypothetical protein